MLTIRVEREQDKPQVRALWDACFHDPEAFTDWFFTERWLPCCGVVADEDGSVIGAMQGYPFTLRIRGKQVPACMLAGVSTREDRRGQGVMPACLKLFMRQAHDCGSRVVFHTPAHHTTFFKCLHYSCSETAFVSAAGRRGVPFPDGVTVETASAALAERLLPVYQAAMTAYAGVVDRALTDMAQKLDDYGSDSGRVLVCAAPDGKVLGYAAYVTEDGAFSAQEVACSDAATRDALLTALLSAADGADVIAKLPPDRADALPDGFSADVRPTGAMGAANIPWLLRELCGFSDATVDVADHMLPLNAGVFNFAGERASCPADVAMDAGRLMQLLLGFSSVDELVRDGHMRVRNPDVLPLLSARLPKRVCYVVEEY